MANLLVFGLGAAVGTVLLLKILSQLYDKYKGMLSYFFAGLILGSARSMIPSVVTLPVILLFIAGFALVWFSSSNEDKEPKPGEIKKILQ